MTRSTSNPKILKESLLSHTMRSANNYCSKDYTISNISADRGQDKLSPGLNSKHDNNNNIKNNVNNSKIAKLENKKKSSHDSSGLDLKKKTSNNDSIQVK